MSKKSDAQVVQDEAAAEIREGERQAKIERDRAQQWIDDAAALAAAEPTAERAKMTFWQKVKDYLGNA